MCQRLAVLSDQYSTMGHHFYCRSTEVKVTAETTGATQSATDNKSDGDGSKSDQDGEDDDEGSDDESEEEDSESVRNNHNGQDMLLEC